MFKIGLAIQGLIFFTCRVSHKGSKSPKILNYSLTFFGENKPFNHLKVGLK